MPMIVVFFLVVPLLCLVLGISGTLLLAKWKRLAPTWRRLLLVAITIVCWLGVEYLGRLNAATVGVNYFGDYFLAIVYGVILAFGITCVSVFGIIFMERDSDWRLERKKDE